MNTTRNQRLTREALGPNATEMFFGTTAVTVAFVFAMLVSVSVLSSRGAHDVPVVNGSATAEQSVVVQLATLSAETAEADR